MQDLVALGTGNSRLMKSNISPSTTLSELISMLNNGTFPYDIGPLNAAGISQQGTPLNKATLLKDATAALFGYADSAVPDDILAYLGKYNQYWWKRRANSSHWELSYGDSTRVNIIRGNYAGVEDTFEYSSQVQQVGATTAAELAEPILSTVVGYSEFQYKNANKFRGNFVKIGTNIYYVPTSSSASRTTTNTDYIVRMNMQLVSYVWIDGVGEWEYVRSSDRNAYPDSGIQDGYEYQFLGRPLDNAVDTPKIEMGSYIGTGTYGASNPNTLTFSFAPQFLIVANGSNNMRDFGIIISYTGMAYPIDTGYGHDIFTGTTVTAVGGTTISWYASYNPSNDAGYQANASGVTYKYIAIG